MAIFAQRTLARLLAELGELLPPAKQTDLRARLASSPDGDGPISAEWEIAIFSCLRRAGSIEFPATTGRQADLILTSTATNERAMVEITAVSDKGLRDKNPIDEFSRYLGKINSKMRPIVGVLNYQIGSRQQDGEVVLGVPEKSQMGTFFRSAPFRAFLDGIRRAPGEPHRYDFECRGSSGCITFRPGATFGSGSYPSFNQINDLRRNHITSRLRKKDQQLRDAKLDLPGIVVLCDGDCAVLKNQTTGLGKPRFDEVVDVFLNGRAHQQSGPWVLQQGMGAGTRRINAVVIVATRENHNLLGPGVERFFEVRYAFNRGEVYRPLSTEVLETLCENLQKNLPPIRTSPINARRTYGLPFHYGGWSLKGSPHGSMTVKISLLALQGLLNGQIAQADFLRDHRDLESYMLKALIEGRTISKISIERCSDEDDDWVHIEFGEQHPERLFSRELEKK